LSITVTKAIYLLKRFVCKKLSFLLNRKNHCIWMSRR